MKIVCWFNCWKRTLNATLFNTFFLWKGRVGEFQYFSRKSVKNQRNSICKSTNSVYRVKYDNLPKFNLEKLTTADRLQLQSDVFALGRAGYAPLTDYFKVLNQYSSETEYTIHACWNTIERFFLMNPAGTVLPGDQRFCFNSRVLADILNNLGDLEYRIEVSKFQRDRGERVFWKFKSQTLRDILVL